MKLKSLQNINSNRSNNKTIITVTICPPECENRICSRVFEDPLGLGYKVYCICNRSQCHQDKGSSTSEKKQIGKKQVEELVAQPNQPVVIGRSDVSTSDSTSEGVHQYDRCYR